VCLVETMVPDWQHHRVVARSRSHLNFNSPRAASESDVKCLYQPTRLAAELHMRDLPALTTSGRDTFGIYFFQFTASSAEPLCAFHKFILQG